MLILDSFLMLSLSATSRQCLQLAHLYQRVSTDHSHKPQCYIFVVLQRVPTIVILCILPLAPPFLSSQDLLCRSSMGAKSPKYINNVPAYRLCLSLDLALLNIGRFVEGVQF